MPGSDALRLLVVGGSGYVGTLVLPLMRGFSIRIFDRVPPRPWPEGSSAEYVEGDVTDPAALAEALRGMDLLLYMPMGKGDAPRQIEDPTAAYDVNVKGLHLALAVGLKTGVRRAVHISTLSVYEGHLDIRSGVTDREDVPPEPKSVYGFTKRLGEEVCAFFHRTHGMPIISLRLFHPVSEADWRRSYDPDRPNFRTSAPDLARAFTAALLLEHTGYEIIHITGDASGQVYHHEKARRLLGWSPTAHEGVKG